MSVFNLTPACFYHPVQTIFLDDNRAFLDALELHLSSRLPMQTFTDPKRALAVIQDPTQQGWQSHQLVKNPRSALLICPSRGLVIPAKAH